ncbi:Flp pilus assembly protein TadG [Sphingomonas sp. F9_3S_D5_B_2]
MMRTPIYRDRSGSAAAEMALVLPLLLVIMTGSIELGSYFLREHTLVKAVRDGAAYAARRNMSAYDCVSGTPSISQSVKDDTKTLVRTGQLSGGSDQLPNWTSQNASFSMTVSCVTAANSVPMTGLYSGSPTGKVPVVTVTAQLPYNPVVGNFGFHAAGYSLYSSEQVAVTGI